MTTWSWWLFSHSRSRPSLASALAPANVAYTSRYRKLDVASRQKNISAR